MRSERYLQEKKERSRARRVTVHWSRNRKLQKFGGKSREEVYQLLVFYMGDVCGICGKTREEYGRYFHIDHDHKTGKLRGLLCLSCNVRLGWLENNISTILKYLKRPSL